MINVCCFMPQRLEAIFHTVIYSEIICYIHSKVQLTCFITSYNQLLNFNMPRKHSLFKLGYEYTGADNPLYLCILKKKKLLKCCISLETESTFPFPLFSSDETLFCSICSQRNCSLSFQLFFSIYFTAGVPNPCDLMPEDMRWNYM